jgi:hypothetical protein
LTVSTLGRPGAAVVVVLLLVLTGACDAGTAVSSQGRNLTIELMGFDAIESALFTQGQERYVVLPAEQGGSLMAVHVTLRNRNTGTVLMLVDEQAASIQGRDGSRYAAVDPFASFASEGTRASTDGDEGHYLPLLWGAYRLDRGFLLSGWLLFDLPAGADAFAFEWRQADDLAAVIPGQE